MQIRLVDALLDHLGLGKVCIAGISYGSEVGLEYAIEHPERVERLMPVSYTHLYGTPAVIQKDEGVQQAYLGADDEEVI